MNNFLVVDLENKIWRTFATREEAEEEVRLMGPICDCHENEYRVEELGYENI